MSSESLLEEKFQGKKVFFLYPHSVIQNEMVSDLIKNEYEIYLLPDHAKALKIFQNYPDSIVFINIDEGQKEEEWEAYIQGVQSAPATSNIRIGILTYNTSTELAQKYLMDLMVPCGFIKLTLGLKESTEIVLRVLEANEAKGRRRFLRVKCPEGAANFNFIERGKSLKGSVLDISSVGMAVSFSSPIVPYKSRTLLSDIQLRLKSVLCMVSAVVMGTRTDPSGNLVYILLFEAKLPDDSRAKIRNYMQVHLQSGIEQEIRQLSV